MNMNPLSSSSKVIQLTSPNALLRNSNQGLGASQQHPRLDNVKLQNIKTLGGNHSYTKDDAIKSAWNKQNSLKIEDVLNGKSFALGVAPPSDFIQNLEKNEIQIKPDFFNMGLDFKTMSAEQLKQSVDYISSRYAVMKEQINANFDGEEKANYSQKLEDMMNDTKSTLAKEISEKVGGFFEENGVSGETEKIKQSVFAAIDDKVSAYSKFIGSNSDYADINGTKDEWLKNDSSFMASELRNATNSANSSHMSNTPTSDTYSVDELEKMYNFAKEISTCGVGSGSNHKINEFGSEEEIGLQLAEVTLKSEMFNKYADVSQKVKDIVSKSVNGFINNSIAAVQKHLDTQVSIKNNVPNDVAKGLSNLDTSAIYAVIDKAKSTYAKTGDLHKSLVDTSVSAMKSFNDKVSSGQTKGVYRYDQSIYFNNLFQNKDKFPTSTDILGLERPNNGYIQKESGIDSILDSWNSFASEVTANENAKFNSSFFSAYA